ncbi:MAG: hypothetical protein H6Q88_2960 [Anaeromyxobacteraceae bacterium]|nr:hypothetical protein [Anaeromyxobacteraceae bacterium]
MSMTQAQFFTAVAEKAGISKAQAKADGRGHQDRRQDGGQDRPGEGSQGRLQQEEQVAIVVVVPGGLPDAIRRALTLFRAFAATRIFLDNPRPDP